MKRLIKHSAGVAVLAVCVLAGCQQDGASRGTSEAAAHLYEGFDGYHRRISTTSEEAQRWFDQGMQFLYGFNHDEAIRSFEQAAQADPDAAMPMWGVAYAHGIHVNNPVMTPEHAEAAWHAAQEALNRLDNESPVEAALVRAVTQRYAWPSPEDCTHLNQAYADAMQGVYQAFPKDPDVAALFAESLMDLQPWDYWDNEGNPKGRADEIVAVLEGVLEAYPDHAGANHFYIHAVEASANPERAVAAAERLDGLVPGAGHLVHMPAHIYVRVGRYSDSVNANVRAVAADRKYFTHAPEPSLYALYYAHNLHFLAYSAMMCGRYEDAIRAARDLEAEVPDAALREYAGLIEGVMPTNFHVMIRFGKWREVLREPDYPEHRLVSRAVRRYARSIAYSALGETEKARAELEAFNAAAAKVPGEWWIFNNKVSAVLPIAQAMIEGELLFREGKHNEAFARLREGIEAEDALVYDEPPGWMLPVRHALGALLMSAGRYAEAEQLYREDLARNHGNGWGLLGLKLALQAQGKRDEADAVEPQVALAWADADTMPTSSCYCEPGGE